jgi:hypothetical protein
VSANPQEKYFAHKDGCVICRLHGEDCSRARFLYDAWTQAIGLPPTIVASPSPGCAADLEPPIGDVEILVGADGVPTGAIWNGRRFRLIEEL